MIFNCKCTNIIKSAQPVFEIQAIQLPVNIEAITCEFRQRDIIAKKNNQNIRRFNNIIVTNLTTEEVSSLKTDQNLYIQITILTKEKELWLSNVMSCSIDTII